MTSALRARVDTAAKLVTDICAPQYLVSLVLLTAPFRHPEASWWHTLAAFVFLAAIPMLTLGWMRRTGRIGDRHVTVRRQRTPLLVASLVSMLTGVLVLLGSGADAGLVREAFMTLTGLVTCLLVTLRWKVSVHAAVGFFAGMVMLPVHLAVGLGALIGWSRIRVKGHTPTQVLGGTWIGLALHYGLTVLP